MQGVLGGLSGILGYVVGAFFAWLWRFMMLPQPIWLMSRTVQRWLFAASVFIGIWGLWYAADWQNAVRAVTQSMPVTTAHPVQVAVVAIIVFALLWLFGSAFTMLARRAGQILSRFLPGRLGPVLGLAISAWVFWTVTNGVLVARLLEFADLAFAAGEQVFDPNTQMPSDPLMSGSSASLVTWEDLGNRGRDFVSRTPSPEEIKEFTGAEALKPIRVYVGRVSAPDARSRAELALEELIRVGGFDRKILIITTPVGTGWMDPGSHDVIDFMFGGDTAHVAAQYSYLTSVLSIITNVEYGLDQSRELFDVIYAHWHTLPKETRPNLYIHGLSQGAFNSQATLPFLDILGDPIHGAFWAGSPFVSSIWSQVREQRIDGSPSWRPRYGNGSLVRTTNQDNVLDIADEPWGPTRMIFLNYGSDPIVNFDTATFWRRPAFLEPPRAPDVSPEMRWYPLVTAFQILLDMGAALAVSEGYGHFYYYEDYVDAWAALTDPPGWSDARAVALKELFETRPDPW